jgi:hypothetical protein
VALQGGCSGVIGRLQLRFRMSALAFQGVFSGVIGRLQWRYRAAAVALQGVCNGVTGCLLLGRQFLTFGTPCCCQLQSRTALSVGLLALKMAAIQTVERLENSVKVTERYMLGN